MAAKQSWAAPLHPKVSSIAKPLNGKAFALQNKTSP